MINGNIDKLVKGEISEIERGTGIKLTVNETLRLYALVRNIDDPIRNSRAIILFLHREFGLDYGTLITPKSQRKEMYGSRESKGLKWGTRFLIDYCRDNVDDWRLQRDNDSFSVNGSF